MQAKDVTNTSDRFMLFFTNTIHPLLSPCHNLEDKSKVKVRLRSNTDGLLMNMMQYRMYQGCVINQTGAGQGRASFRLLASLG